MPKKIAGLLLIATVSGGVWSCCMNGDEKSVADVFVSGNETHAAAALQKFTKTGGNNAALLSEGLRPTEADYEVVFETDFAKRLFRVYEPAWNAGQFVVAPKPEETTIKLFSATSDEMINQTGAANEFSAGWRRVAPKLKRGIQIYGVKFVAPGSDLGTVYEGLVCINGNWRFFPKPWRAMD
jgi:hypothetical protein